VAKGAPLRVGSAFPDPPFEVPAPTPTGFDIDLMTAVAAELGRPLSLHRYAGADFDGIFAELGRGFDVVASGATIAAHRRTLARWCDPYGITTELLGVAVALDDAGLAAAIDAAQRALCRRGELAAMGRRWFADSDPKATGVLT
jgi:ABC-type amino acid transport substrate-binding protein